MGSGSYTPSSWKSYKSSTGVHTKSVDQVYKQRAIAQELDPKRISLRESRDSADNPLSTPIIVALDVTGSMGYLAEQIDKVEAVRLERSFGDGVKGLHVYGAKVLRPTCLVASDLRINLS